MTFKEFMNIELSMGYLVVVCLIYTVILIIEIIRNHRKVNRLADELEQSREASEYRW
jgi:dolichyl-phosphate-mannose--protein O-mannosyl transferase